MKKKKGAFRGVCLLMVAVVLALAMRGAGAESKLVHKKNSLYHQIFVYRDGSVVSLKFGRRNRITQSRVDLERPRRHLLEYSTLVFSSLLYAPDPDRVLIVGLGGGVIPREMRHYFPDARIDVVEIDGAVRRVARDYFRFRTDERMNVHIRDGRVFIRQRARQKPNLKYDIVVLDAFNSDYIPFHLMTREFLHQVKEVLAGDGVVAANVFSTNRLFDAEWRTFESVFGGCQAYFGTSSGNAMIIAPGEEVELISRKEAHLRARELQERHGFSFDLRRVARKLRPDAEPNPEAAVLTDDRAPVNKLRFQERGR
jgi:spermidine synthase